MTSLIVSHRFEKPHKGLAKVVAWNGHCSSLLRENGPEGPSGLCNAEAMARKERVEAGEGR